MPAIIPPRKWNVFRLEILPSFLRNSEVNFLFFLPFFESLTKQIDGSSSTNWSEVAAAT